jgi:lysophospholipase L1-like esterase
VDPRLPGIRQRFDFDKATRNVSSPLDFNPAYDSGDHLHFNHAGYQAMANAMNLADLLP